MRDHGQVVAHHDKGKAAAPAQFFQQVQHLGLHRRIERRRGFVQQQDLRLENQRARDRDALALPAGELVRVAKAETAAEPDFVERAFDARLGIRDVVDRQRFGQDPVDRLARMQRPYGSWNTICTSRRNGFVPGDGRAARRLASTPSSADSCTSRTVPDPTGASPQMARSTVDLPEPDSPTMPKLSPASTRNEVSATATNPPIRHAQVLRLDAHARARLYVVHSSGHSEENGHRRNPGEGRRSALEATSSA